MNASREISMSMNSLRPTLPNISMRFNSITFNKIRLFKTRAKWSNLNRYSKWYSLNITRRKKERQRSTETNMMIKIMCNKYSRHSKSKCSKIRINSKYLICQLRLHQIGSNKHQKVTIYLQSKLPSQAHSFLLLKEHIMWVMLKWQRSCRARSKAKSNRQTSLVLNTHQKSQAQKRHRSRLMMKKKI